MEPSWDHIVSRFGKVNSDWREVVANGLSTANDLELLTRTVRFIPLDPDWETKIDDRFGTSFHTGSPLPPFQFAISKIEAKMTKEPNELLSEIEDGFKAIKFEHWVRFFLGGSLPAISQFLDGVDTVRSVVFSANNPQIPHVGGAARSLFFAHFDTMQSQIAFALLGKSLEAIVLRFLILENEFFHVQNDWFKDFRPPKEPRLISYLQDLSSQTIARELTKSFTMLVGEFKVDEFKCGQAQPRIWEFWQRIYNDAFSCASIRDEFAGTLCRVLLFAAHQNDLNCASAIFDALKNSNSPHLYSELATLVQLRCSVTPYLSTLALWPLRSPFQNVFYSLTGRENTTFSWLGAVSSFRLRSWDHGERNVLVFGHSKVGKSTWINKMTGGETNARMISIIGQAFIQYRFSEIQEDSVSNEESLEAVMKRAQAIVVIYSIDSEPSFQFAESLLGRILCSNAHTRMPRLLVGTKGDLSREDAITEDRGKKLSSSYMAEFYQDHSTEQYTPRLSQEMALLFANSQERSGRTNSQSTGTNESGSGRESPIRDLEG